MNTQNKTMNSLDITSLYTNIPTKKCLNLLAIHLRKIKFYSPLPVNTLVNTCKHITNMTYFKFNNKFYKQKYGLLMRNPLSGVLACLFREFLEFLNTDYLATPHIQDISTIYLFSYPKASELKKSQKKWTMLNPPWTLPMKKNLITPYPFWTSL